MPERDFYVARKRKERVMEGIVDIHCHIVPKVDDGAENFRMAQQMMYRSADDNIRCIIATPHYRPELFRVSWKEILLRYGKLCELAERSGTGVEFYQGCEVHCSADIVELIKKHSCLRLGGSRYVLLEFPERYSLRRMQSQIYDMTAAGFIPIVAHAERYPVLAGSAAGIRELRTQGAMIQVNAGSVTGQNGWKIRSLCATLMKDDLIDFFASDAHNMSGRRPDLGECARYVEKKMGFHYTHKVLVENPMCIIREMNDRLRK